MKITLISLLSSTLCLASLEQEYAEDTARCVETAKTKHLDNPNAGLDHFVNCILARLQTIPEDNDSDLKEVKTTLKDFEKLNYDEIIHNIVRREAEEDSEEDGVARGWKNKDKKNKKKKKKQQRLEELLGKIESDEDLDEVQSDVSENEEEEEEEEEEMVETENDADKNVVQFSVYSGQPRPMYSPPQSDKKKYLFSVDYQGNAHYIDEEEVSALLRNPQAMKAMMSYLGSSPDKVDNSLRPGQGYRVPENRLYRPPPPPPHPAYSRIPPAPPRGPAPRLEYFGPKDFKPESAFLIPQTKIRPTMLSSKERVEGREPVREKLEPKPRRRRSAEEEDDTQGRMGIMKLFRKTKPAKKKALKPEGRNKKARSSSNRQKNGRKNQTEERCKKCENPKIAEKSPAMCKKCKKKKTDCKKCKNEKYRKRHSDCQKCAKSPTTEATKTPTSPVTSERSMIQLKKKCRAKAFKKKNVELCKEALDKCNSRMFRTTHQKQCKLRDGDREWLTEKCSTKVFVGKNEKLCQSLKEDPLQQNSPFKLEELVSNCKKSSYKKANKNKCQVVEALDETIDEINATNEEMNEVDMTKEEMKQEEVQEEEMKEEEMIEEEMKEDEMKNEVMEDDEDEKLDAPSKQKSDIVKSIKKQTAQGKKKNGERKKQKQRKNKDAKKNQKSKTKEEKEKKEEMKEKKKNEKGKEKEKKEKGKEKEKKKEKKEKSKCNKPKYASTHPDECKSINKLERIFIEKCRKEKYRMKHTGRCRVVEEAGADKTAANEVLERLMDVRCRKEAFRKSYPSLCLLDKFEENILETTTINPAWLRARCKHEKFQNRNVELCKKIKDYELDVDSPESLIDNVINDIKNIVSHETIPPIVDNPLVENSSPSSDEMTTVTTEVQKLETDTTPPSTTPTTVADQASESL